MKEIANLELDYLVLQAYEAQDFRCFRYHREIDLSALACLFEEHRAKARQVERADL
jgi:hypothetical protein